MNNHKIKWTIGMVTLMIFSVGLFAFAYNQIFDETTPIKSNEQIESVFTSQTESQTNMPIYDSDALKAFDGKNNKPAYIAYEGTVYDVSDIESWSDGNHQGVVAGMDITEAFSQSPHKDSILKEAMIVGVYSERLLSPSEANNDVTTDAIDPTDSLVVESTQPVTSTSNPGVFNSESLSQYDGINTKAYIAVDGLVYDVTDAWTNGQHQGLQAGQDLSTEFSKSPHSSSLLSTLQVIGTYEDTSLVSNTSSEATSTGTTSSDTTSSDVKQTMDGLQVMSLEELRSFNGKNNQQAYIAVNGIIYDVTNEWRNGEHQGLSAGRDLTNAFASSPHSASLLNRLPIVGQLSEAESIINTNVNQKSGSDDEYEDDDHEDDDEYDDDEYDDEHDDDHEDEEDEEDEEDDD